MHHQPTPTPLQVAELLEKQNCPFFTIFHSNKRDAAFRYYPEGEPNLEEARATMENCAALIGAGRFWVELKPKKTADKGTVVKIWMQVQGPAIAGNSEQQPATVYKPLEQQKEMQNLLSEKLKEAKEKWELEKRLEELETSQVASKSFFEQLLENRQVQQACQQIIMNLATKLQSGSGGQIGSTMNQQQQASPEEQKNIEYNRRVLIACGEIQTTIAPWGQDIAAVLERLAVMAKDNPSKLKTALNFL